MTDYDRGFMDGAKEKDILIHKAREKVFDDVLECIDRYKYSVTWASTQRRWAMMDEFREEVIKLKDGKHE